MAHRKPLGTTCRTVADWRGEKPLLGHWLRTPADTWYLVVGVEEKANPDKVGLVLERVAAPTREDGWDGLWWGFEWYARDRKSS